MKSRFMLVVVLLMLCTLAFAQSGAAPVAPSDARKSFDTMKTLAGTWEGPVTFDPPQPDWHNDKGMHVSLRVTSRGNALIHEMQETGTPLDPTKYDHPVTTFYLDGDQLTLIHYCDAGNRPHMVARPSPDGKKVEFDFVELSGGNEYGHMYHAMFSILDSSHHLEDWTFMMPGEKPVRAHVDLKGVQ